MTYQLEVELIIPLPGFIKRRTAAQDHAHGAARSSRRGWRAARSRRARDDRRILLFTGKGGVGKTTPPPPPRCAAPTPGSRTIVLSTDPAHSLADSLDVELGAAPTPVVDNLWGQQLDAQERMEEAWGDIQG